MKLIGFLTALVVLIILAVLPRFLPSYYVGLVINIFIFGIFAMSLDLLLGYVGLPSLGHAAFLGVAAYSVGVFSLRAGNNFLLATGVGLGMALAIAALFGVMVLRARGSQFLMLTLALAQVLWGIAFRWNSVTGGDNGFPGIPRPVLGIPWDLSTPAGFYYFALLFFVFAVVVMYLVVNSPFGQSLEGIRESETRMRALGYNVWLHQYLAFLIAGFFGGLAGVILAYYNGFVSPTNLSVVTSAEVFLMVVLGGAGTLFGPLLGAGIIVALENAISAYTERWLTVLGIVYVLVVVLAPSGIYSPLQAGLRRLVRR